MASRSIRSMLVGMYSALSTPAGAEVIPADSPRRATPARVALVIASLDAGGAERVMSIMANYWAARDWQINLITIDASTTDFYTLDSRVNRVALGAAGDSHGVRDAVAHNFVRIRRLGRALRAARPDVVISFMPPSNVQAVIAGRLERVPVIISERNDPARAPISMIWDRLRRATYPHARAVVVQTPEVRQWAEGFVPPEKVHTIPNPVSWPLEEIPSVGPPELPPRVTAHRIVAMGRLNPQKGFDILLQSFAKCRAEFPDWSLLILGEGEERARLTALASQLGISDAVTMPGRVRNTVAVLRDADLFVLSSRYEGFPNALLEAMAAGVAVISTDCRSGPRHIVRDGVDGLLVPEENVDALAAAMRSLMSDEQRRRSFAERAVEIRERYSVDRVMEQWERLIEQVAPAARRREIA